MPHPYTIILFWMLPTFTVLVSCGALLSMAMILYPDQSHAAKRLDLSIGILLGAVIMARLFHVMLDWQYFSAHRDEILRVAAGGLNWHGAVTGGLLGFYLVAKWRKVHTAPILEILAVVLPLMMFFAWWGCGASACAYGAEIQNLSSYPSWAVWEERDIYGLIYPRYATQPLGMITAAALTAFALLLMWRGWVKGRRFGLMLALVSLSMLVLGFLRGDTVYPVLDLTLLLIGLILSYAGTDDSRLRKPSPER